MIEEILIVDYNQQLVEECAKAFSEHISVKACLGNYFDFDADLMVSPANSFGFMDGGLDLAIRTKLGVQIEDVVRAKIAQDYLGELPIGSSIIVETNNDRWPYLGVAPTMRIPGSIDGTLNVYYAFRSLLLSAIKHNEDSSKPIKSVLCPGLGTGIGGMSEHRASRQMLFAYEQLLDGGINKSARQRLDEHSELELLR